MDGAVTLHIGSEIEKADGQVVKAGNTAMQSNGNSAAQPESGGKNAHSTAWSQRLTAFLRTP